MTASRTMAGFLSNTENQAAISLQGLQAGDVYGAGSETIVERAGKVFTDQDVEHQLDSSSM